MSSLRITVNGNQQELPPGTTIAALLEKLGLQPKYVAVERNRELVPRQQHAGCLIEAGDEMEIVTLVGGG
jgi:thiamine biosynthesis protein ThiS